VNRNAVYYLILDPAGREITRVFLGPKGGKDQIVKAMKKSLMRAKGKPTLERLIELLHNERAWVRGDAAEALGHLKSSKAVPALTQALSDPTGAPSVAWQAIVALGKIGPDARTAIPPLNRLIANETRPVNEIQMALIVLSKLDPKGKEVLPTIRHGLLGKATVAIGAAIAAKDLGKHGKPLLPDLQAAAARHSRAPARGYLDAAIKAVQAN
jgi:hypothetical protein